MKWFDISLPLRPGIPQWPGDPVLRIDKITDRTSGDAYTLSGLYMGLHTGTHMDAPCHFTEREAGTEVMPLDVTIGPARVIDFPGRAPIGPEALCDRGIRRGQRLLLKTRNSDYCYRTDDFCDDYVSLSPEGARWLVQRGVRLVGIDYLSIAGMDDAAETHTVLLAGGVWILEGLDLRGIDPGRYDLLCLPLRLPGRDGAPARAILRLPGK